MLCFIGQTHIQASKNAILSSAPVPELVAVGGKPPLPSSQMEFWSTESLQYGNLVLSLLREAHPNYSLFGCVNPSLGSRVVHCFVGKHPNNPKLAAKVRVCHSLPMTLWNLSAKSHGFPPPIRKIWWVLQGPRRSWVSRLWETMRSNEPGVLHCSTAWGSRCAFNAGVRCPTLIWQRLVSAPDPSVLSGRDPHGLACQTWEIHKYTTKLQSLAEDRVEKECDEFPAGLVSRLEIYMSTNTDR